MPTTGDRFITTLKNAHLNWGTHRYTNSRDRILGEGYLQIPANISRTLNITNSNSTCNNVYICDSADGFLKKVQLKSTGCRCAGDIYAKQFHGSGNLKTLGNWFRAINAQIGDQIQIEFISSREMLLTKI